MRASRARPRPAHPPNHQASQRERARPLIIRPFRPDDLEHLIELTIDTFGPFYEEHFQGVMGRTIFEHQHGNWREDYRRQVPQLHRPTDGKHVAVAEADPGTADTANPKPALVGYVAWNLDEERHHGEIDILAVSSDHRGHGAGRQLCEHAFAAMKAHGIRVVEIGTGGDPFHAPARGLYENLGCTPLPATVYFKEL